MVWGQGAWNMLHCGHLPFPRPIKFEGNVTMPLVSPNQRLVFARNFFGAQAIQLARLCAFLFVTPGNGIWRTDPYCHTSDPHKLIRKLGKNSMDTSSVYLDLDLWLRARPSYFLLKYSRLDYNVTIVVSLDFSRWYKMSWRRRVSKVKHCEWLINYLEIVTRASKVFSVDMHQRPLVCFLAKRYILHHTSTCCTASLNGHLNQLGLVTMWPVRNIMEVQQSNNFTYTSNSFPFESSGRRLLCRDVGWVDVRSIRDYIPKDTSRHWPFSAI